MTLQNNMEDSRIVLWLRKNDTEWARLSNIQAMTKWERAKASAKSDPKWDSFVKQARQAYLANPTQSTMQNFISPAQTGFMPQADIQGQAGVGKPPVAAAAATPETVEQARERGLGQATQYGEAFGQIQPPPSGYIGYDEIEDPTTKRRYALLGPDIQFVDLLNKSYTDYLYKNRKLYDLQTGELIDITNVTDPKMKEYLNINWNYFEFANQAKYTAFRNELINSGVTEEDLQIPEVAKWVEQQMGAIATGKGADYKKASDWIMAVGANERQLKKNQEDWTLHQNTPANVWMDKDIMREKNPQGYQSDEYQWQPLVKKATAKPQGMAWL
jgi:hypothetical protein